MGRMYGFSDQDFNYVLIEVDVTYKISDDNFDAKGWKGYSRIQEQGHESYYQVHIFRHERTRLNWEESRDLVMDIEFAPSVNNDIVMPINGRAAARFVSKCTISTTSSGFSLALQVNRSLWLLTITFGKAFDLGTFLAGTWLVFASETLPPQNNIHYINRPSNPDDKSHVSAIAGGIQISTEMGGSQHPSRQGLQRFGCGKLIS
jgi:hypothetical protein